MKKFAAFLVDDFAKSGLTITEIKKLYVEAMDETRTKEITGLFLTDSIFIPYYDINGEYTDFYRLKLFGCDIKYWQPKDTLPRFYLPTLLDWASIASNTDVAIFFTEGEKKAAALCKAGYPAIGLGGVWSWKSKKAALNALDDFKFFTWPDREVTIVFDSDLSQKPQVLGAMHALASHLTRLGVRPTHIKLPDLYGEKCGVDDYLVAKSVEDFAALPRHTFDLAESLWSINDQYAVIRDLPAVYDVQAKKIYSANNFISIVASNKKMSSVSAKGEFVEQSAAKSWLLWEYRREHSRLTYSPGQELILPDGGLNIWPGFAVQPKKGDIKPWNKLLGHIFDRDHAARNWFERWCAYPIQNPGAKMYSAVLFWGRQGAGKTLVAYTLGKIYGDNFSEVQRQDLFSANNDWAVRKQFILVEEATGSDKREDSDKLKHLITRDRIRVNEKYVPNYFVEDRANYFLTSNHPDALYVESGDRRMFIWEMPRTLLPLDFYTKTYDTWYKSEKGQAALMHHLQTLDLGDFNALAPALVTEYKTEMVGVSASDLDLWCRRLLDEPESCLRDLSGRDLYTVNELVFCYGFEKNSSNTTIIALTKALRRTGFAAPRKIQITATTSKHLIAVKNMEYWYSTSSTAWAEHYTTQGRAVALAVKEHARKYQ